MSKPSGGAKARLQIEAFQRDIINAGERQTSRSLQVMKLDDEIDALYAEIGTRLAARRQLTGEHAQFTGAMTQAAVKTLERSPALGRAPTTAPVNRPKAKPKDPTAEDEAHIVTLRKHKCKQREISAGTGFSQGRVSIVLKKHAAELEEFFAAEMTA